MTQANTWYCDLASLSGTLLTVLLYRLIIMVRLLSVFFRVKWQKSCLTEVTFGSLWSACIKSVFFEPVFVAFALVGVFWCCSRHCVLLCLHDTLPLRRPCYLFCCRTRDAARCRVVCISNELLSLFCCLFQKPNLVRNVTEGHVQCCQLPEHLCEFIRCHVILFYYFMCKQSGKTD